MRFIFHMIVRGFGQGAMALGRIQWQLNGIAAAYVGIVALCIFLAAHEKNKYVWVLLAAYIWAAINTVPAVWAAFKALGLRFGEQWSKKKIDGAVKALLVFGAVPFFWTGVMNTSGHEMENLVLLISLPTVMTFCVLKWPESESAFTVIGYLLIAFLLILALLTVYNTFDKATTDKDVQVVQSHQSERAAATEANNAKVAECIRSKLQKANADTPDEEKAALTPKEWEVWQLLGKKANGASGVQGAATKARQVIEQAKPSDMDWWTAHWYIPAGLLALLVLVAVLARKKSGTTGTTGTSQGSGHGILTSHWWLDTILAFLLAMAVYLLWYNGPGWYEVTSIPVTSMKERKVCLLRDLPNKPMRFIVPNEERGAIRARIEEVATGQSPDSDLAASMLIEGANRSQTFQGGKQCLWVKWAIEGGEGIRVVDEVVIPVKILVAHKWGWLNWLAELFA